MNRKLIVLFAAALIAAASCATKNDVDALQSQIDELKNSEVASILNDLKNVDNTLKSLAEADKAHEGSLEALEASLKTLDDLSEKLSIVESVSLENYEFISESITSIESSITTIGENIEPLTSDFETAVGTLRSDFETALGKLQTALDKLTERVAACELDIESIKNELASRIESITYVPDYNDGKITLNYNQTQTGAIIAENPVIYYEIQPASLASVLASNPSMLSLRGNYTQTRAGGPELFDIPIVAAKSGKGLLAVTADVDGIDASAFKGSRGLSVSLLVKDETRSINSEYVAVKPVRTDIIIFEDPAFKEYCLSQADFNNDGEISADEGLIIAGLDVSNKQFFSLVGVGMFPNLIYLTLPGNTAIKELDLSSNINLEGIDIKGCTSLESLDYKVSPSLSIVNDYALGYVLTVNGEKGVVAIINSDGTRKLLSCASASCSWDRSKDCIECGAIYDDGALNTEKILYSINCCDAANWCVAHGENWYLPSSAEILLVTQHLNEISANASLILDRWVWTSNEDPGDKSKAYNIMFRQGVSNVASNAKDYTFTTYAMMRL
ncbi:MAG: hypothetical protein MJY56_02780 [Bacteroidales bacterium]|nr:hypothetical protein [Bacteroidales bacterium]